MGLGHKQQGIPTLAQFKGQKNRHGLGYKPEKRKEKSKASVSFKNTLNKLFIKEMKTSTTVVS